MSVASRHGAESWVDETLEPDSMESMDGPGPEPIPPTIPSVSPRRSYPSPIRTYMVHRPLQPIPPLARQLALGTGNNRQLPLPTPTAAAAARRAAPRRSRSPIGVALGTACIVIGGVIGGAIAFTGTIQSRAVPAPVHALVAPTPIASIPPAPAPVPVHVTVRLISQPAGAQATLIDHDKPRPIGATPVDIDLDPARGYDIAFTLVGHDRTVAHVDPKAARVVTVVLDARAP